MALPLDAVVPRCVPHCAVCGRVVDSFTETRDLVHCVTTYTVRCHGQIQTVELDDIVRFSGRVIGILKAFDRPALTEDGHAPAPA